MTSWKLRPHCWLENDVTDEQILDFKMAKIANVSIFLPFLGPLQAIKHHQTIFFL